MGNDCMACLPPGGKHFDEGKPRVDLLPPAALVGVAEIFGYGAKKYGERNWQKGVLNSKLLGSTLRHIFAHMGGETVDKESGLPHLNHALCDLMMIVDNMVNRPEMDDRLITPTPKDIMKQNAELLEDNQGLMEARDLIVNKLPEATFNLAKKYLGREVAGKFCHELAVEIRSWE